jgi:hypothetical protein
MAAKSPLDILARLPLFQWRRLDYPLASRSVSFAHDSVPHKLEFRNGEFREQTGARGMMLTYTLPMREGIAIGPYRNLFNRMLPQLLRDFRDKTPGDLVDPVYGLLRCVPGEWRDDTDVRKRDGTDLQLSFFHDPDISKADPETKDQVVSLEGVRNESGALDQELKTISWEQEPSPEPTVDIFGAVSGFSSQITNQADRVAAALDDLTFRLEKTEASLDKLENPQNWRARDSVRRHREAVTRVAKNYGNPNKKIQQVTTNAAKTLSVIASEAGMTLIELIKLNPKLARAPIVGAGTVIRTARNG